MRFAWPVVLIACGSSSSPPSASGSGTATPADAKPALTIDDQSYDQSCTTAADCAIVKRDPCNMCTCPKDAIAKSELPRLEQATAATTKRCPEDGRMCKKCSDDYTALCVHGSCAAVLSSPDKPAPCTEAAWLLRGKRIEPAAVLQGGDCWVKGTREYMTNADIAKLVGRELTPRESTTVIFEVTDRDRFDAIVRCNGTPPKIDWKTQRVWFALTRGERISNSVLAFDDGKTITLVQRPMSRAGCGGMNGGYSITTIGLQIPRDRTIELQDCPVPVNCTGLEK